MAFTVCLRTLARSLGANADALVGELLA